MEGNTIEALSCRRCNSGGGLAFVEKVAKLMGNVVARGACVIIGREEADRSWPKLRAKGDALGSAKRLGRKPRKSRVMSIGGIG
ncbi:hypothetical protein PsorP6_007697 [Peronosclerospora sorghi]|uniref:Uncharacterized protein n=1 Tax=Peronosclerospora sorghi TaxID=230839 RepID=A0ACC0W9Q0_9STRA|nr:hypothetical protein PsorP6_007697 [Peronosclerospora sorghi]